LQSIPNISLIYPKVQSIEELENRCNALSNEEYEELKLPKEEVNLLILCDIGYPTCKINIPRRTSS